MKKLTALIFSAVIVPALALSSAALADDRDDDMLGDDQRDDMERDQEGAGMEQDRDQEGAGEQRVGQEHISGKPAGAFYADDVIGNTVKHRGSDEDVGEIQDLIIGEDGNIVGVVVTTGGFLGLGGQDVGLGWDHIEHTMEDDESVFYTDMDEETLRNAPEYERD